MRSFLTKMRFILLLCGLLTGLSPAQADDKVMLNFVNAEIEYVLQAIGKITGKNFVIDPRVKGTINIVSYRPVNRETAFKLLLSALRLQGFTAVETGGVTKVVPEADAKQNYNQTASKDLHVSGDRIVTQVYPLQFESAQSMVNILRPLITPNNTISASPTTNTLVITDYADNIRRLNKIIESIDQPGNNELSIIKLNYASALDLAQIVSKLMADGAATATAANGAAGTGEGGSRFSVMADTRTNSLLVWTDRVARLERVKNLVASLDVPTMAAGNIHVVYLRNADATKLAETLRGILSQSAQANTIQAPAARATTSGANTASSTGTFGGSSTATSASSPASPGGGIITADAATNSLIITAPDNVYNSLRTVIDQLDSRRAQVLVEALIAEVTSDKVSQLGVQWQGLSGIANGSGAYGAGTNFGSQGNILGIQDPTNLNAGMNIGIVKKGLNLASGAPIMNLAMLANALATDSNTNILSTPNIVTLDNEEASILVGENVPFITGSYATAAGAAATTGSSVNPFQTVDRKDVGLTLKVKPQVTEGGTVKLKIYQEVSDIKDTSNPAGIITDKRSIDSTVQVDDGQIIVLGGLMKDQVGQNASRVPGLSSIPLLGGLFRNEGRTHSKTDLMVFLRPYILRKPTSADKFTLDRYEYIRNAEQNGQLPRSLLMPNYPGPQLPRPIILPAPTGAEEIKPAPADETPGQPVGSDGRGGQAHTSAMLPDAAAITAGRPEGMIVSDRKAAY